MTALESPTTDAGRTARLLHELEVGGDAGARLEVEVDHRFI